MQIKSINPYCQYNTNSVSMNGRIPGTKTVVSRVRKFLGENNLYFDGKAAIGGEGVMFPHVALGSLNSPYFLRMADGAEKELRYFNCTSADEVAYKFAKEASGKTIYNHEKATLACIMSLLRVDSSPYKPTIKVPDFFA